MEKIELKFTIKQKQVTGMFPVEILICDDFSKHFHVIFKFFVVVAFFKLLGMPTKF